MTSSREHRVVSSAIALATASIAAASGTEKVVRVLSDAGFSIQIDRTQCRPWGIDGGTDGEGADGRIEPADGEAYRLLKGVTELRPGDRFRLRTGGGGGFGPPEARDPERVAGDVAAGYVTPGKAREVYRVALDDAGDADRQQRRGPAALRQRLQRIEDRLVLDGGSDEVAAAVRRRRLCHPADRQVVGFGAAAGEDDVVGPRAEELRHRRACVVEGRLGRLTERVDARRVAEAAPDRLVHGVGDLGGYRSGGVVIQICAHWERS